MWDYKNRSDEIRPDFKMAPQVGLEPTTLRLTAGCSAIELLRSVLGARPEGAASFVVIHNIIGGGVWGFQSCARQRATLGRHGAQLWGGLFLRRRSVCRTTRYVHVQHPTCISPDNRSAAASLLGRGLSGWEIFILVGAGIGSF